MSQTFKQKFGKIEPARRAQVVFGMDTLHRKYLATNGGKSGLSYDPVEHLTDEETIREYVAVVRQTADPHLLMQARVDAARARQRLADEAGSQSLPPADDSRTPEWPTRPERPFRNHISRPQLQRLTTGKALETAPVRVKLAALRFKPPKATD